MRIAVFKLRRVVKKPSLLQVFDDLRVCLFHEQPCKRSRLAHISLFIYQLDERHVILPSHLGVVLTKRRCDVYHAGTVGQSNIGVTGNEKCFFILLICTVLCTLIQRLVFFVFQLFSFIGLQHLVSRLSFLRKLSKNGVKKRGSHVIYITVCRLYLCVFLLRVYTEADVGRQSPRRGGPCQEVSVLADHLEPHDGGAFFYILISLSHLLSRQRSSAARAVRHDLESFV